MSYEKNHRVLRRILLLLCIVKAMERNNWVLSLNEYHTSVHLLPDHTSLHKITKDLVKTFNKNGSGVTEREKKQ